VYDWREKLAQDLCDGSPRLKSDEAKALVKLQTQDLACVILMHERLLVAGDRYQCRPVTR
jgi:hypothetical protein